MLFHVKSVLIIMQVDYNKLAELCGMSNPRSASNAWAMIKKKIMAKGGVSKANGEDGATTPKATPSKAKATPKRKKKNEDLDDAEGESPTKKGKGKKGQASPKSETKVDEEDEDAGSGASPIKKEESDGDMT